jgi:hypothetical protein
VSACALQDLSIPIDRHAFVLCGVALLEADDQQRYCRVLLSEGLGFDAIIHVAD